MSMTNPSSNNSKSHPAEEVEIPPEHIRQGGGYQNVNSWARAEIAQRGGFSVNDRGDLDGLDESDYVRETSGECKPTNQTPGFGYATREMPQNHETIEPRYWKMKTN